MTSGGGGGGVDAGAGPHAASVRVMTAAHPRAAPVHAHCHGGRILAPLVADRMPELPLLTIFSPTGIVRLYASSLSIDAL